ncbi:hypothetical protein HMPREF1861_00950 [Corynebacterium kroppenstedtii]|nr:hypothetical protein HMPREF1861_00950 [Corynebacterium kroppenstedtii]
MTVIELRKPSNDRKCRAFELADDIAALITASVMPNTIDSALRKALRAHDQNVQILACAAIMHPEEVWTLPHIATWKNVRSRTGLRIFYVENKLALVSPVN